MNKIVRQEIGYGKRGFLRSSKKNEVFIMEGVRVEGGGSRDEVESQGELMVKV